MAEPVESLRLRVHGQVQGVWFRDWAVAQAQELGLSGWVRNRQDGSVEAVISGPLTAVRSMVERCRRGPPAARVDAVLEEPADGQVRPGFRQLPTI
jgi:acylphosphatase